MPEYPFLPPGMPTQPENPVVDNSQFEAGISFEGTEVGNDPDTSPGFDNSEPDLTEPDTEWSEAQKGAYWYNNFQVTIARFRKTGKKVLTPTGTKDTPGDVVRIHSPSCTYIVTWVAERNGDKPVMPHWDFGDPNWVLTDDDIVIEEPSLLPDGQFFLYKAHGKYVYDLAYCPDDASYLPVPTTAAIKTPASELAFGPGQFDPNMLKSLLTSPRGEIPTVE